MMDIDVKLDGFYTVKYYRNNEIIKEKKKGISKLIVDENSSISLSIYDEKNMMLAVLGNIFLGFFLWFLASMPKFTGVFIKKYTIYVKESNLSIERKDKKIVVDASYKTFHLDYVLDLLSGLCVLALGIGIAVLAIKLHWFEK